MKRILYLHIGTGKAGTSTIQELIGKDPKTPFGYHQVRAFGLGNCWKLTVSSRNPRSVRYWITRNNLLSEEKFRAIEQGIWQSAREEVERSGAQIFVGSSEFLKSQLAANAEEMAILRDNLLEIFDEVRIVAYVRHQVPFIKSLYSQFVRGPLEVSKSYDTFVADMGENPVVWNYELTLRCWSEVFGQENVRVALFDREAMVGGDLIQDFLALIDCELPQGLTLPDVGKQNVSLTPFQISLLRQLNKVPVDKKSLFKRAMRRLLVNGQTARLGPARLPDRHDAHIIEVATSGNVWVNEVFLGHSKKKLPVANSGSGGASGSAIPQQ